MIIHIRNYHETIDAYRTIMREMDKDNKVIRKRRGQERPKNMDVHRVKNASFHNRPR